MQNGEKNDQFLMFFWTPESFRLSNKIFLLQIKIAKTAF